MSEFILPVIPRKSSTAGEVPSTADLQVAEIAVNTADGKLFVKHTDDTIKEISGVAQAGAVALGELTDVDLTSTAPTAGDVLIYDATLSSWVPSSPAAGGGGATIINQLTDVDTSGLVVGDVLKWDGVNWVPKADLARVPYVAIREEIGTFYQLHGLDGFYADQAALEADGFTFIAGSANADDVALSFDPGANWTGRDFLLAGVSSANWQLGSNGCVTFKASGPANFNGNGEFTAQTSVDFIVSWWGQDTETRLAGWKEHTDATGMTWLIVRADMKVPYSNETDGYPVEAWFGDDGRVRVIYGALVGTATALTVSNTRNGIATFGKRLVAFSQLPPSGGSYGAEATPVLEGLVKLGELDDVTVDQFNPTIATTFEPNELQFSGGGNVYDGVVDSTTFSPLRAYKLTSAANYGDGKYLQNVLRLTQARYDIVSLFIRSDQAFSTSNRQSLGGTKASLGAGAGWTLYTRDTGFGFYGNGAYTEVGVRPVMPADTWINVAYVLDWEQGRNVLPKISIWVDGVLVAGNYETTHAYTELRDGTENNFYLAYLSGTTSAGNRWVSRIQIAQTYTLPWGMSDANVPDIPAILDTFTRGANVGDSLMYDGEGWVPSSLLGYKPTIGLDQLQDVTVEEASAGYRRLKIDYIDSIHFQSDSVAANSIWAVYANTDYGVAIGEYSTANTLLATRIFFDPSAGPILNSGRTKKHWLMGAFSSTTEQPELRWTSGNPGAPTPTGNSIGLKLPAGLTQDTTYTFPVTDGAAGQALTTDGAGQLAWADPAASVQIQQADDFALFENAGLVSFQYDTIAFSGGSTGYDNPGEAAIFFGNGGERVIINKVDSLGASNVVSAAESAVTNNGGSTSAVPVWLSMDGGAWTSHTCTMAATNYSGYGPFLQDVSPEAPTSGSSLRVTFDDPALPPIPLASGDMLLYDGTYFRPVQAADVFVSLSQLKAEVAASTDFADFQARIAAL